MKKFFSLVCAALMVLSAGATNLVPSKMPHQPTLKVAPVAKAERTAVKPAGMKKAPQSTASTINLNMTGYISDCFVYYPETGDWYFEAKDATGSYTICLDWYSTNATNPCGTYAFTDMDADYSIIMDYVNFAYIYVSAGSTLTVATDASGALTVTGTIVGSDGNNYVLNGTFTELTIQDTISVNIPAAKLVEIPNMGVWQMAGYTADSAYYMSVAGYATTVAGLYPDLASFIGDLGEYNALYDVNTYEGSALIDGSFSVTANADGTYSLQGAVQAGTHWVLLTMTATPAEEEEEEGNEYDMQQDVVAAFTTNDLAYDTTVVSDTYSLTVLSYINSQNEAFSLGIYHPGTTLGDGTYTFGDDALAGSIDTEEGYVDPSYYGTLNAQNQLTTIFLCTGGTVVVSHDAAGNVLLNVSATNTWDSTLTLTVSTGSALQDANAEAAARKLIRNGQLIIVRDGIQYNALGNVVE